MGADRADQDIVPEVQEDPQEEIQDPPVRSSQEGYYKRKAEKAFKEAEDLREQLESRAEPRAEEIGLDELIDQRIEEKYSSKLEVIDKQQRRGEAVEYMETASSPIKALYNKNKERIWKFWDHDSRKNLPFKSVLFEVIGEELAMEGAKRAKEADEDSQPVIGSSVRQTGDTPNFSKMSTKEFKEWEQKNGITGRDYLNHNKT